MIVMNFDSQLFTVIYTCMSSDLLLMLLMMVFKCIHVQWAHDAQISYTCQNCIAVYRRYTKLKHNSNSLISIQSHH